MTEGKKERIIVSKYYKLNKPKLREIIKAWRSLADELEEGLDDESSVKSKEVKPK